MSLDNLDNALQQVKLDHELHRLTFMDILSTCCRFNLKSGQRHIIFEFAKRLSGIDYRIEGPVYTPSKKAVFE